MSIPDPRRLLGVVSALIIWAVWFVVVYALSGIGCRAGWNETGLPGGNLLSLLMLASTLIALGLIGRCAWQGYKGWRGNRVAGSGSNDEAAHRARFLGLMMMLASLMAAIGTLLGAVPIFMLDPCAA